MRRSTKNPRIPAQRRLRAPHPRPSVHFPLLNNVSVVHGRRPVIPPETDVLLSFQVNKLVTNAASTTCLTRYQPNSAFDVDPILGSTSTPGFAEWALLYSTYRVIKIGYKVEICNNEAFPVRVYTFFQNTDPGTVGNSQFPGNPLAKSYLLSAKGGMDRTVLSDTQTVATIAGARGVEFADKFASAVTTSPAELVYLGIGANSVGITFLPNGFTAAGIIKMWIRFTDTKPEFS